MDWKRCGSLLIFGGSFDPPHMAHIVLPTLVRERLGMDATLYVPCAAQPLKAGVRQTAAEHRLAMLRLALHGLPGTVILTDEIDRGGDGRPSYTIDTLRELRRQAPDATLHLLIGADQASLFDRWREADEIQRLAKVLVMLRPPLTREQLLAQLPRPDVWEPRLVELPQIDLSATFLRRRASEGLPLAGWVHPRVEQYVRDHQLYRGSPTP